MAAPVIGRRSLWTPGRVAQVNPRHPLAAGLWFYAMPGYSLGGGRTGTPLWASSPHGRAIASTGINTAGFGVRVPRIPGDGSVLDFTFHTIKAQTARDIFAIFAGVPHNAENGTWADPWWTMAFASSFNTNAAYFHVNKGGAGNYAETTLTATGLNLDDGRFHSYTGAWGPAGARVWRDGVLFDSSATAPNGSAAYTPQTVNAPQCSFLGRSPATAGEGFTGTHVLSICWLRRLSDDEVAQVHGDPFAMLVPHR